MQLLALLLSVVVIPTIAGPIKLKVKEKQIMETQSEKNKSLVKRYNKELIEQGNAQSAKELLDVNFVNHSASEGQTGSDALLYFFNSILRPGISNLKVVIDQQVAEGELVTTHKRITGTHSGTLMGIPQTGKEISIEVIDILRIHNNKITDHWGVNTFPTVLAELAKK